MDYDIKKDTTPQNTIEKIKKILEENNIETICNSSGQGQNYCSVRVRHPKFNIGTNGKGINELNAKASGYAEFMERLQTQFLVDFKDIKNYKPTDEKIVNILKVKNDSCIKFLKKYNVKLKDINAAFNNSTQIGLKDDEAFLAPFVSYKKKKIKYTPLFLIAIQGSNGLAAGNTYEEACTQALSEIIERNCLKNIYKNKIKLPTIPKEVYEKYDKLTSLIKEIEELGYKITIKDASLGLGFPTVCAIFEDIKYPKNGISISFGTHPYFAIALERVLTEFMQGCNFLFSCREDFKIFVQTADVSLEKLIEENYTRRTFCKKTNKHIQNFLSNEADYIFKKNTWLYEEKTSNKKMFNNLAKLILQYYDDIYIRNCSFLGFPAVQIFAPEISFPRIINENYFKNLINSINIKIYKQELEEYYSIDDLINVCELIYLQNYDPTKIQRLLEGMETEYIAFYCSIVKNNKKYIKKYLKKIIKNQLTIGRQNNSMLKLYQGFNRYFKLKWKNYDNKKIQEMIEKQYSNAVYNEIIRTIKTINEKQIFDSIKTRLENQKENEEELVKKELKYKLYKLYQKNPPNQNEIIKIIDKKESFFEKIYHKLCPKTQFNI